MTLPLHPSDLRTTSFLHNEKKLVATYSQQVVNEYMSNPLAPVELYRPTVHEINDTVYLMWNRFVPDGHCWDLIKSSRHKVHSNSFRCSDLAERKLLIATERRLALLREILACLDTAQDKLKLFSEMETPSEE